MKLNRLVARHAGIGRNQARLLIAASRVTVDGIPASDGAVEVDRFHEVLLDGRLIRPADRRLRLMFHKPRGVLSATSDAASRPSGSPTSPGVTTSTTSRRTRRRPAARGSSTCSHTATRWPSSVRRRT